MSKKQKSKKARKLRTFMANTLVVPPFQLDAEPISKKVFLERGLPPARESPFSVETILNLIERIKSI
jgi:hypothetical protein